MSSLTDCVAAMSGCVVGGGLVQDQGRGSLSPGPAPP
jgi:hypothetical protein